jgi:hypothetical protein
LAGSARNNINPGLPPGKVSMLDNNNNLSRSKFAEFCGRNFQLYNLFQNPYTQVDYEVTIVGKTSSTEGEGPRPKDF